MLFAFQANAQCDAAVASLSFEGEALCLGETLTANIEGSAQVPEGFEAAYLLTTNNGLSILDISETPSFPNLPIGVYRIHQIVWNSADFNPLNYPDIYSIYGDLIIGGGTICGDIDLTGASCDVITCSSACENGVLSFCDNLILCTNVNSSILICPSDCGINGNVNIYSASSEIGCDIQPLSNGCVEYTPYATLQEGDTDQIIIVFETSEDCFVQTAHLTISANCADGPCDVDGGNLSIAGSTSTITEVCLGQSETINVSLSGAEGNNIAYLVTDGTATTILAGPTSDPEFSFDGAPPGTCLIWAVAYDSIDIPSDLVADINGCFSLSNPVSVIRLAADDPNCQENQTELIANPDAYNICENADMDLFILDNDIGDNISLCLDYEAGDADPEWGHVFLYDGYLVYQSAWGVDDSFTYTICDQNGNTAQGIVNIESQICNQIPDANNDQVFTDQGQQITIDVLANDEDPDDDGLDVCPIINDLMPNHGTAVLNSDGTVTYTPDPEFVGLDIFAYTVCDGNNDSDRTKVYVMVLGSCEILPQQHCIGPQETLELCIDFCIENVEIEEVEASAGGVIVLGENNCFSYSSNAGFVGNEEINIEACEPNGFCENTNVLMEINPNCEGAQAQQQAGTLAKCSLDAMVIPNLISPNFDGINDQWLVKNEMECFDSGEVSIEVFNRYGQMVFSDQNIIRGQLSGADRSIEKFGQGTFFYQLTYKNENDLQTKTGFVEIIR